MNSIKVRNLDIGAGIPKICVPIVGTDRTAILDAAKRIPGSAADLAEWRRIKTNASYDMEYYRRKMQEAV